VAKDRVERDDEDLVRLYLTDIGQYTLLTKDDEVRLAKAIEAGKEAIEALDVGGKEVTPAKKRELRRLAQQNERLADIGAVTARIAHDFGNPLASLTMTAQRILHRIARDPTAPAESLKSPSEMILETTLRLDGLVQEFKEFARETRLEFGRIDMGALLADVVRTWHGQAADHGVEIDCLVAPAVPPLRADEEQVGGIIQNRLFTEGSDVKAGEVDWTNPHAAKFREAMDDDFNTPEAVAVLFELANEVNSVRKDILK